MAKMISIASMIFGVTVLLGLGAVGSTEQIPNFIYMRLDASRTDFDEELSTWDEEKVSDTYSDLDLEWTGWLDGVQLSGLGQFENVFRWMSTQAPYNGDNCDVWCPWPIALKWQIVPSSKDGVDITQMQESCVVLHTKKMVQISENGNTQYRGFNCFNSDQMHSNCTDKMCLDNNLNYMAAYEGQRETHRDCDLCPNFRVNYLCNGTNPYPANACPSFDSTQGPAVTKRALTLDDRIQKLDVEMRQVNNEVSKREQEEETMKKEKFAKKDVSSLLNLLEKYLKNEN